MLYIAGPFRAVLHLSLESHQLLQNLEGLVQVEAGTRSNIEHPPPDIARRSFGREQIRMHRVIDVGEITALLAVAQDSGLFAIQHLRDELRQHTRIWRRRVLPRAKDIEVA